MATRPGIPSGERAFESVKSLSGLGIRFAGSAAEKEAALWVRDQFEKIGFTGIDIQEFPCKTFSYSRCSVKAEFPEGWRGLPAEPAAHSHPTSDGILEGDLLRVEKIPPHRGRCRHLFENKIPLLYCSEFFEFERFRRVLESDPKALVLVDDRFPNDWTVAIGFPRYWIDFIHCPVVNIPYTAAWKLVREGVSRVRIELAAQTADAISQNVIAEIPGCGKPEEIIVVSGHHDSVINNPGADDNCTGVASVLELARIFRQTRPRRTLRFISYGAEEQLSEGALFYAAGTPDLGRIVFVLNVDSVGALMGRTGAYYCGTRQLRNTLESVGRQTDVPVEVFREISPFSDHFPLNLAGIPCVWYYRTTFGGGRHFHHSARETLEVVSPGILEEVLCHQAALLELLSREEELPFPKRVPRSFQSQLRSMARKWCGPRELVNLILSRADQS